MVDYIELRFDNVCFYAVFDPFCLWLLLKVLLE